MMNSIIPFMLILIVYYYYLNSTTHTEISHYLFNLSKSLSLIDFQDVECLEDDPLSYTKGNQLNYQWLLTLNCYGCLLAAYLSSSDQDILALAEVNFECLAGINQVFKA